MFFPKLRRQAKWMFVFLALAFGIGFVAFGIGGTGGSGISDLFQREASSGGPSVEDAREKIEKGDLSAYKELTEAYRADGKQDEAIAAGEKYVQARPKDYEFMRSLAGDYEGKATREDTEARIILNELTATTGGTTFGFPGNSPLGRAVGMGRIDRELTTAANQKLTELYGSIQSSYSRAAQLYQRVAAVNRDDVLLHMLLGGAAYRARENQTAINAYKRVIKIAPDSFEADEARQQIQLIRLEAASSNSSSG